MPHHTSLIAAIVGGIVLAFLFGAAANRLRISPLVGYLLAGVVVGPFTPGFVADQELVAQLAEIGAILLMFGVGLHCSLKDLLSVKSIAVPGAGDAFEAGTIVERARALNPSVPIIARSHSDAEHDHLMRLGATHTVLGERELAREMLRKAGFASETPPAPAIAS